MDTTTGAHDHEVLDFLLEWALDRQEGRHRSLLDYLARHPGREEAVAREYLQLLGRQAEPEGGERDIGPYHLLAELGRGAQGAVWLARDGRLDRDVALKVLHRGHGATTSPQRFRREALVAARLDHPSLATVFDAGEHDGRLWLAMRYVPGEPLGALLARHRDGEHGGAGRCLRLPGVAADARERDALRAVLECFGRAARALEFAHAAGVVHRDVKPGNLMITPAALPVLVDFGLARDADSSAACLTNTGEQLGTPAYMAPELLLPGRAVLGPQVDVWGLAVVLYEVTTGVHPFAAATRQAMQNAIVGHDPTPARRLNAAIPRGLDTVLEVALQKDPRRRHRSAADLAMDLELLARGEAPRCQAPGPLVRIGVLARRHPGGAVALLLAASFAVIAIVYLDHAWRVEAGLRGQVSARATELRGLARSLLFDSFETVRDLPGAMQANRELSTRALEYLQLLRAEASDDPGLRADVVMALLRVGDVHGNPRHANLGDLPAARAHYAEALRLLDADRAHDVAQPAVLRAQCLLRLGELQEGEHDLDAAMASWRRALQLCADAPDADELAVLRATLHLRCGETALWTGVRADRDAALASLREALAATTARDGVVFQGLRASVCMAQARLLLDAGDHVEATAAAQAADAALAALPAGHEHRLSVRSIAAALAVVRGALAWRAGEPDRARDLLERARAALTTLGDLDPDNEQVARLRLQAVTTLAIVLVDQERHADCEVLLGDAMAFVDAGAQRFGADWFEEQRADVLTRLGQLRYDARDMPRARELMQQVVDIQRARVAAHPRDARIGGQLAQAQLRLGWALVRSNDVANGRAAVDAARAALTALLERDPADVTWRKGLVTAEQQLAELAFQRHDFDAAARHFGAAAEGQAQLPAGPDNERGLAILHQGRGESRLQLRDFAGACEDGALAVAILRRVRAAAPQDRYVERLLATALVTHARFLQFAEDPAAEAAVDEALTVVEGLERSGADDTVKLLHTKAMAQVMRASLRTRADRRDDAVAALTAARETLQRLPEGRRQLPGTYGMLQRQLETRLGLVEAGR